MQPISELHLSAWLDRELPAFNSYLSAAIAKERREDDEALSAYFVFSAVLKPYIEQLLDRKDTTTLTRIFALLEQLATAGDAAVQNDLGLMMEDMEEHRHRIWPFLAPVLQQREFSDLTWFPTMADRTTPCNTHVDQKHYQDRWREEITKLGGFEQLTIAHELQIRYQLVQEFSIVGLRALEPGGAEWQSYGLPWPIPKEHRDS